MIPADPHTKRLERRMNLTLLRLHVWMAIWNVAKKLADVAYDRAGALYCRAVAQARETRR